MARTSDKERWGRFWASSRRRGEVYSAERRIFENLEKHVELKGSRVLEVGAGTGRDAALLAENGASVYALDYSEEALALSQESLGRGSALVCADAGALPFGDESFDIVFHQGLLEHFREPEIILQENRRVLKKGGILLVDVPQRYHYYTLLKHTLMACNLWFAGWETEFSAAALRRIVAEAGFEVVDVYGENLFPPVWYRGVRKILLRFGLKLPMYPGGPSVLARTRRLLRSAIPRRVLLNTSMVIGCVARKGA